jgi:hypothetical protein
MALIGALVLLLPALGAAFAAEAEPAPPEGVTILLNGNPMSGEGGKIASCVLSLDISGLEVDADPATAIGVTVNAVGPTVEEGTEATLVDDTATTTEATWSSDYDMTALVAPYERKPNGYHLRVIVSINDVPAGVKTVWLGCGEPQTGSPSRLVFAVNWQAWDGTVLPGPPADLAVGWESAFALDGSVNIGPKGTARCTYEPGTPGLICEYANPGHGGKKPGLILPGSPQAEYTVTVNGIPVGWKVDPATVGTFVGRDTCPRGHGEDEGGHEGEVATIAAEEGGGEGEGSCTHTVVLIQDPPPDVPPGPPAPAEPGPEALGAAAAQPVSAAPEFTG